MRKPTMILLILLLLAATLGCAANNGANSQASALDSLTLEEIMDKVLSNVSDLPSVQNVALTSDNFETFAFIPMPDNTEGLVSEGMISSIAHSVVLVRAKDDATASTIADEMRANANPSKWICVTAEKTEVLQSGRLVMLVMSFETTANTIIDNFTELTK